MTLDDYIDERNSDIMEIVRQHYTVSLIETDKDYWGIYSINKTAIIYAPKSSGCKDSFTHELLHVYLKAKGVLAGNRIILLKKSKPVLENMLPVGLWEHVGNCMDHLKMLPVYLARGFAAEKFIEDYHQPKCTKEEMLQFFAARNYEAYKKDVAEFVIVKYFAMKACPNKSVDYNEYLKILQSSEPALYTILDIFWTQWESFDIDKMDAVFNDYGEMCHSFVDALEEWVTIKGITA